MYCAARLYKAFRGDQWKQMTIRTALMFPGVIFAMFFILDLLVWGQKSSGAVPFGTLVAICFLWFGVSVPLVFVGSYFGFKKPAPEDPVRTNKIPRQIPEQPWYMHPVFSCLVGGVLPFGAVFIGECGPAGGWRGGRDDQRRHQLLPIEALQHVNMRGLWCGKGFSTWGAGCLLQQCRAYLHPCKGGGQVRG